MAFIIGASQGKTPADTVKTASAILKDRQAPGPVPKLPSRKFETRGKPRPPSS